MRRRKKSRMRTSINDKALPTVAIIVLNWNQRDLTLDCFNSVTGMNYPLEKIRLILVDNGSKDHTIEAVEELFPESHIVDNGKNLGFAEGNNCGIRLALNLDTDYVMLLNNDTIVHRDLIAHLVEYACTDDKIGILAPKVYLHDQPQIIWSAGSVVDWHNGETKRLLAGQLDNGLNNLVREIDFGSGCALFLRREVVEEIGLMDYRYFLYYEEADWCQRAKSHGWSIRYAPSAKIWHRVSKTIGNNSPAIDYYMHRNVLLFLVKNHPNQVGKWLSIARAVVRNLFTIIAYTLDSKDGSRIQHRNVRLLALRDGLRQRWGPMPSDVANICN